MPTNIAIAAEIGAELRNYWRRCARWRGILIRPLFAILFAAAVASANPGPVTYVYDAAGRVTAVVDGSDNAASYNYDSVGNLLSIVRPTAAVNVLGFNPNNGPVSTTTVTIYGTGFSTTPSSNTVKFNGAQATVSSATTTTVVATVPSGATTGSISVQSPSGLGTSSASFTVTAN